MNSPIICLAICVRRLLLCVYLRICIVSEMSWRCYWPFHL